MRGVIDRLAGRLNRVFDKTPQKVLALRVRSDGGLAWLIAADVLTVSRPGLADLALDLADVTLAELRDVLLDAGCDIVHEADGATLALSALTLLDGWGDQDVSNGDHLYAYSSLLWSWLDAVGRELGDAKDSIVEMLQNMTLTTSHTEWTDMWGAYFNCVRRPAESDSALSDRIAYELRRARSNPVAMRASIKHILGFNVEIREPWREMMMLSGSVLGEGHLPDAIEFCYHTAQAVSREFIDLVAVEAEIDADRPAGTIMLPAAIQPWPWVIDVNGDVSISMYGESTHAEIIDTRDSKNLSINLALSDSTQALNFAIYLLEIENIPINLGDAGLAPELYGGLQAQSLYSIRIPPVTSGLWLGGWGWQTWDDVGYGVPTISMTQSTF
ncbi:MAG: hypothetical protein GC191_09285 [Azospirillum sp.]|nr:hypothetical protein [Azospirillum sp.]